MSTEPTAADRLHRSLELLWGAQERPTRGPKPSLTLDRVVDAAITVADEHGVDGLSMRCVARALGVGTMSLYRYVPGKSELLDLMLDRICAPDRAACPPGSDWRAQLAAVARGSRALYLAHPWLLQVNWARPVLGPNSLAGMEQVTAALAGLGLTDQERISVMITIDGLVVGVVRSELMYARAAEETGISDEEFWARHYPVLEKAMASGAYPAMAALSEDSFNMGWEDSFEWGLQRLLDGLAALVDSRR